MGKKRIFEIAKEYGVKSPEVIELLAKHNIRKTNFKHQTRKGLCKSKKNIKINQKMFKNKVGLFFHFKFSFNAFFLVFYFLLLRCI